MPQTIFINGRFLTQKVTGVQRFCREMTRAIDELLMTEDTPLAARRWVLLTPRNTACDISLGFIETEPCGRLSGHLWEQLELGRRASRGILVSFANSTPLLHKTSITIVHDVLVYRFPQNFSVTYRILHQTMGRLMAARTYIGTVSDFSRSELADVLGLDPKTIFLARNAGTHLANSSVSTDILGRLHLQPGRFFLVVGTGAPNKNLERAFAAFSSLSSSELRMVVVGSRDPAVFKRVAESSDDRIILAGRLSDPELANLYKSAIALVFPSLYEGFGIPPLEAMAHGCPVLSSRIPPVEEVCGDAAVYFEPLSVASIAEAMQQIADNPEHQTEYRIRGATRAKRYSWQDSAHSILNALALLENSKVRDHSRRIAGKPQRPGPYDRRG